MTLITSLFSLSPEKYPPASSYIIFKIDSVLYGAYFPLSKIFVIIYNSLRIVLFGIINQFSSFRINPIVNFFSCRCQDLITLTLQCESIRYKCPRALFILRLRINHQGFYRPIKLRIITFIKPVIYSNPSIVAKILIARYYSRHRISTCNNRIETLSPRI